MGSKIGILKIKRMELLERRTAKINTQKEVLVEDLLTPWDEKVTMQHKMSLIFVTKGALGTFSTEEEIKLMILKTNRNLFNETEYNELVSGIMNMSMNEEKGIKRK